MMMCDAVMCYRVSLLTEKRQAAELLVVLREQLSDLLARLDFCSSWYVSSLSFCRAFFLFCSVILAQMSVAISTNF